VSRAAGYRQDRRGDGGSDPQTFDGPEGPEGGPMKPLRRASDGLGRDVPPAPQARVRGTARHACEPSEAEIVQRFQFGRKLPDPLGLIHVVCGPIWPLTGKEDRVERQETLAGADHPQAAGGRPTGRRRPGPSPSAHLKSP
jgi:hypothetical protein